MKKAIIIGAGFSGCTSALFLKEKGYDVTIVEKSDVLGGGCRTFFYKGHPYTEGPRHLNIDKNYEKVWDFFNSHFDLRLMDHRVCTLADNQHEFFNYPPVLSDIERMDNSDKIKKELDSRNLYKKADDFEDFWINSVGRTLYEGYVDKYSKKMWGIKDNKELTAFVNEFPVKKRILKMSDDEYLIGQYVAYPKNLDAYNPYFDKCVENCAVLYNTIADEYDIANKRVKVNGEWLSADIIIITITLDEVFNYQFGELRYRGRDFIKLILPIERITPSKYYFMYYAGDEPYTRVVEYKLLTGYESSHTLLGIEFPSNRNKLYPYPLQSEIEKANKYKELLPDNVYAVGRMAQYKYMCMGDIVKYIYEIFES